MELLEHTPLLLGAFSVKPSQALRLPAFAQKEPLSDPCDGSVILFMKMPPRLCPLYFVSLKRNDRWRSALDTLMYRPHMNYW